MCRVEKLKIYYPTRHPNAIKNTAFSFEGKIYAAAKDKVLKYNLFFFLKSIYYIQNLNLEMG